MKRPHGVFLVPGFLIPAHTLCIVIHDVLLQMLQSGEKEMVFWQSIPLRDQIDLTELESSADVFEWLEKTGRTQERLKVIRAVVFPALLSDFLHFLYEALDTARKAKLTVAFSLLRKPLQEALFIFEMMLVDLERFGSLLIENPQQLYSQQAGGIEAHTRRVDAVLDLVGEQKRFDPSYIVQLRYDKESKDGFDGVCNKATHLFTGHPSIQTEKLNVNLIFSNLNAKMTQWEYLYSRLPYLLIYAWIVIEHLCAKFGATLPKYSLEIDRRISAGTILWASTIRDQYEQPSFSRLAKITQERLIEQCKSKGFREPSVKELYRMFMTGAFPGESALMVRTRNWKYERMARRQSVC